MFKRIRLTGLAVLAATLVATFVFTGVEGSWDYVVPRRAAKVAAISLTGAAIAASTVVFQTITSNQILTPSIIGLDSLYLLTHTFLIYILGSSHIINRNPTFGFILAVLIMMLFAGVLYRALFRRPDQNLTLLLLLGVVFGTLFGSFSSFMQVLIDPNEFLIVQNRMFASFNNIKVNLLTLAAISMAITALYAHRFFKYLDVLALGREHAISLGVRYHFVVKRLLIVITILTTVATALIGPITFLGLLVANLTYQFLQTHRHEYLLPGAVSIAIIALIGGQLMVERVFTFSTTISVIINFIGGVYFIFLLLKEAKA